MGGFRELARETAGLVRLLDELAKEHAITRGGLNQVAQLTAFEATGQKRSLWGRLRWLFLGR